MKQGSVKSEDVLLYKDGAKIGRKSFFMDNFPFKECAINEHVFILRSVKNFSQFYLYFWLDQDYMTSRIINLNSNCAQPGINRTGVNSLDILIPDMDVTRQFDNHLRSLMKKIFSNCLENLTLSGICDSLLPRLMSGRIRVKDLINKSNG